MSIRRLRDLIPEALNGYFEFPENLSLPPELQYDYMAYQLAKYCKIPFPEAMQYKETEYYKVMAMVNLDTARENFMREYLNRKKNE